MANQICSDLPVEDALVNVSKASTGSVNATSIDAPSAGAAAFVPSNGDDLEEYNEDGARELTEDDIGYNINQEEYVPKTFDEQVEHACHLMLANPLNRPAMYQVLLACQSDRRHLGELEQHMQSLPELTGATQPPYFLIQWLANANALDTFELDAQGEVVSSERTAGLSADEIDDLIEDYAFETNEVGQAVLERFSVRHRLAELLEIAPDRYDTYMELLEFLKVKRPFPEVDSLLRGRDVLMSGRESGDTPMQPSVFIDKLANAGGVVWDDGWQITTEGKELLEAIKERSS